MTSEDRLAESSCPRLQSGDDGAQIEGASHSLETTYPKSLGGAFFLALQAELTDGAPLRLGGSPYERFPSHSSPRSRGSPPGRDSGVRPLSVTCDSPMSKQHPLQWPQGGSERGNTPQSQRGSSPSTGSNRSWDPPWGEEAGKEAPGSGGPLSRSNSTSWERRAGVW